MSKHAKEHRHKRSSGKSFIILPVIFFLATYLLLYFTLYPTVQPILSTMSALFLNEKKDYSSEYTNIFVPVENNSTDSAEGGDNFAKLNMSDITFPRYGNLFGKLIIEDCGIDCDLFFGDGNVALRNGVGLYDGSCIPGYGGTSIIAGHNNTFFNPLKYAEAGQEVLIRTNYGNYTYRITETAVKKATAPDAYDLSADYDNLVMYTCYPFDALGLTPNRFFVYAEYVSGPLIDKGL